MAARALGAAKVFAVEPNPNRAASADELGVDQVIDVGPNLADTVLELSDGVGVDASIECSGTEAGFNSGIDSVRAKGTVVQAGLHTGMASVDPMKWCLKDLHIEATWAYPIQVWPRVSRLVAAGQLPVERVVSSEIDIQNIIEEGFERLVDPSGTESKVLVTATQH
jgi:(R,R)-butanediol dehydrogenase / meso-butanediol dehydrogenase / diacetyl reductase